MYPEDTIAAVATPPGEGGVGIVRISGPKALYVAQAVFAPARDTCEIRPLRLYYGTIKDPSTGRAVDDGYMVYMKGPRSFTGEDTVELHCHGGLLVTKKVLEAVLSAGARTAGPGEFTRRAFLNGKLDLSQAEAVCDLIRAQTESAMRSARGRLKGGLSRRVNSIKEILLDLLVRVEAELDFAEDEIEETPSGTLSEGIERARGEIEELVATYEQGRILREGVKAAILGRPNTGKSSLLNILLREERAIVTDVPGTTRDVIEEVVVIRGLAVRLMDTAGLRDTVDEVESIGVERARERVKEAALVLFVVDSSSGDFSGDRELLETTLGMSPDKKVVVVANKMDLVGEKERIRGEVEKAFTGRPVVFISAFREEGIGDLEEKIVEEAVGRRHAATEADPGELVTSLRHKEALLRALEGLERAGAAVENGLAREFIATDLRWSVDRLGEITGETTTEDILDRIFSSFCIGK